MLENAEFHHIGMAVASLDSAMRSYADAGFEVSRPVVEPIQKVRVAYARRNGFPVFELLEPMDESSPAAKIIKRNGGNAPYHVCYAVPNLQESVAEMRRRGFVPLARPVPGHGLQDALMLFLYSKDVGLVQLVEKR